MKKDVNNKKAVSVECLKDNDSQAVREFREQTAEKFSEAKFILFGSKAQGRDEEFSDIDVLIILRRKVTTLIEKGIFDIGFDVGLKYGVVFGIVVEEDKFWNSSLAKEMPFYKNVHREGVVI